MSGTAKEIIICGKKIKLGDYLEVEYTTGNEFKGRTIKGKVVELWDQGIKQGRLDCGWCFHDNDTIIRHKKLVGNMN